MFDARKNQIDAQSSNSHLKNSSHSSRKSLLIGLVLRTRESDCDFFNMGKQDSRYTTKNCKCLICGTEFYCIPSRIKIGNGKFCSKPCMGIFKKGKHDANLTYKIPKGTKPWNAGLGNWIETKCETCEKPIRILESTGTRFCSKKCSNLGLRVYSISKMSYATLHDRIRDMFGTPSKCEHCKTTESKRFEWANISREYKFERSDWARLCCKCHRRYDRGTKNKIHKLCV